MPELKNFAPVRLFNHSIGGWGRCLNKKADSLQMWVILCACSEATIGCKLFFFFAIAQKKNKALPLLHHIVLFFPWWIDVMKWCRWISCRYCVSTMCYQVHRSWPDWANNTRQLWIMHDAISPACACCSGKLAGDSNVPLRCHTFVQRDHMESRHSVSSFSTIIHVAFFFFVFNGSCHQIYFSWSSADLIKTKCIERSNV